MTRRLAVPLTVDRVGRLGNSLFQVASTIGVALDRGYNPAIPDDWTYRPVFNVPDEWFVPRDAMGDMPNVVDSGATQHIHERWRPYLQDVSLFADYADTIRDAFTLTPAASTAVDAIAGRFMGDLADNAVCVHVRRGDNVSNERGTINCLPFDYYHHAMVDVFDVPVPDLVIFSDDPQYCEDVIAPQWNPDRARVYWDGVARAKEQMASYNTETDVLDWVDLALMASRIWSAYVCSNSTYAWWAAFLSGTARVIYPSYWVGPQLTDAGFDPGRLFTGLPWVMVATGSVWDERP